jgi:lambda repressor-like predicted transcriptional regulator
MTERTEIQELLAQLRAKGWTYAAIATEMEVEYHTIVKWQRGIHMPRSAGAVRRTLQHLLRRKRIPKQKRYTRTRNRPSTTE